MPIASNLSFLHATLLGAIKTSAHTSGKFKRIYDHIDKPGRLQSTAAIGDLPALELLPIKFASPWVDNQSQQLVYTFQFSIWTPEWSTLAVELLYMQVIAALMQSLDSSSPPGYVFRVQQGSEAQITLEQIENGPTVTRCTWEQPVIAGRWNPRTVTP